MRKIKTKNINPEKLVTKSQYAKDNNISPTAVQNRINRGELTIVVAKGAELVHL